ncbi:ABC transporter permease [Streptomyces sp. NPDC004539]|uniref:ABC transporter permease n=1 Tax=Streptomyces sp. NPDC004539 TaxID=3154280 RepID=UPI0033A5174D
MLAYIVRRVGAGLVLAALVTLISFLLLSLSFDSVVRAVLGSGADPRSITAMKAELGFDRPVVVQYLDWLGGVLHGDFGVSLFGSEPVGNAIVARLGVTLSVVLSALVLSTVVSVALGVLAATRGGIVDRLAQGASLFGYVVPNLLIAITLVAVLAVQWGILPAGGYTPLTESFSGWLASITIPVISLSVGSTAALTAQVRGSVADELRKDYVRTLRTRGLRSRDIVLKHVLRNAAGPALTVLSIEFIGMLGGALIMEKIFALPGYGTLAFNSSLRGDIPMILGITLFGVLLVVIVNLVVDIVNGYLKPKARLH